MTDMEKIESELTGPQPSETKTIILWGQEDLLTLAVKLLLLKQEGWKVIRVASEDGPDCLVQVIERAHPEAVIIYESVDFPCLVSRLLERFPGLKLITINSANNYMEVYNKQTICIKEGSDLMSIIEEIADLDKPGGEKKFSDKLH